MLKGLFTKKRSSIMIPLSRNLLSYFRHPSAAMICIACMQLLFMIRLQYLNLYSLSTPQSTEDRTGTGTVIGNVFVCITGQRQRLELHNKVKTILIPLREAGYEPHVALMLTDEERVRYVNYWRNIFGPAFDTVQKAEDFLLDHGFHVTTQGHGPIIQPGHPVINKAYSNSMRVNKRTNETKNSKPRMHGHGRQFYTLTKCGEEMTRSIQDATNNIKGYDFSIRIREDVGLTDRLPVDTLYKILYSQSPQVSSQNRTAIVSDCRSHGGMNDRMAVVSREASYQYFHAPFISWYTKPLAEEQQKVRGPESYLLTTYEAHSNIRVVQSSILRFVVKLEPTKDGSFILVNREEKTRCPEDSFNLPWHSKIESKMAYVVQKYINFF